MEGRLSGLHSAEKTDVHQQEGEGCGKRGISDDKMIVSGCWNTDACRKKRGRAVVLQMEEVCRLLRLTE